MSLSEALVKYGGQGWRPNSAAGKQARAIVMGESSGNPGAENYCCVGLFQLNKLVHAGKWGSPKDQAEFVKWAKDPANNIHGAYLLWNSVGRRWSPTWSAYNGPQYTAALAAGTDPVITIKKGSATGTIGDAASSVAGAVVNPFTTVAKAIVDLVGALMSADTWFRIGKTGLGAVMVILGAGVFVFVIANKASGGGATRAVTGTYKANKQLGTM